MLMLRHVDAFTYWGFNMLKKLTSLVLSLKCAEYCNVGHKHACFHTQLKINFDIVTKIYVAFLFCICEIKQEENTYPCLASLPLCAYIFCRGKKPYFSPSPVQSRHSYR